MELKGCAAIVTGGSGGLGRRISRALALNGVNVAVAYAKSKDLSESIAKELTGLGPRAIAVQMDVTATAGIQRAVEQVHKEFGRIDILVNDAAFNKYVTFQDLDGLTLDLWEFILKTNLTGPFQTIKAVAPIMRAQKQGRIINISSSAGFRPRGSSIAYAVSKAGLNHLTKCMAVALAPDILVNCIAPGYMTETRMTSNLPPEHQASSLQMNALKRPADKDDIAEQVVGFARTNSTTGQTLEITAGRF